MKRVLVFIGIAVFFVSISPAAPISITYNIDATGNKTPISPYIYGTNGTNSTGNPDFTVVRSGGNRLTAYNWENNYSNAGADWYYSNDSYISSSTTPGKYVTDFRNSCITNKQDSILTLQMAGYVSADGAGNVNLSTQTAPSSRFKTAVFAKGAPFCMEGRNAIYDMVKVVEALRKLPPVRMTLDGHEAYTELNVSMIQGGIAVNIVPGECKITCERRVLPNEEWASVKELVQGALDTVKDVEFRVSYMNAQKSYLIPRDHPAVTLATDSTRQVLGYSPEFKVESGRTDSTYFNEAGIKTVIIGPGEVAHVADEYVNVKRLEEFSQVLYRMLSERN